jgi:hypothetical protein
MNPDELCICGHTLEVHFGHDCSRLYLSGQPCPCKQFVLGDFGVELFEVLKALLPYLPDRNDALDYAATNDGRASNFQVAALRARELFSRIQSE